MQFPMWANNSADDPTFDALIEQAELDELWARREATWTATRDPNGPKEWIPVQIGHHQKKLANDDSRHSARHLSRLECAQTI